MSRTSRPRIGRRHIYRPALSEERTQKELLQDLLDRVFAGSAAKLVMRALSARKVSPKELKTNPGDAGPNGGRMTMPLLESLFSQGTIERLGWMLVHFLWQATAVALLLAVLLRLLRRSGANLRYAVACGALALMVVLPLITMQLVEVPGPAAEAGPLPEISLPATATPVMVCIRSTSCRRWHRRRRWTRRI